MTSVGQLNGVLDESFSANICFNPCDISSRIRRLGTAPTRKTVGGKEPEQSRVARSALFSWTNRGWQVASMAFLSTAISVGTTGYAFGPFIEPLETEFGWTRAQINISLSLTFVSGVAAPFVGRLMDRFGTRSVMTTSLILVGVGFVFRPFISELWHLYLFSVIVYLGMPGSTVMPAGRLVTLWFPEMRGRMMGIVTSGNNFGGITIVPLAAASIAVGGWRLGYVSFGLLAFLISIIVFVLIRDAIPPNHKNAKSETNEGYLFSGMSANQAVRSTNFYLLTLGIGAGSFTYSVILTQLIPHLETEGFSKNTAAAALTTMAVFGLFSKLIFGRLSESITARLTLVISLGIQSAGLLLLVVSGGSTFAWAGVAVFGLGFGSMGALIPLMITEMFGLKSFGTIMGLVSFASIFPQLVGPVVAGMMFDAFGDYALAFSIIVVCYLVGMVFVFFARSKLAEGTQVR